ncbi:MAG: Mov34/MPN/PAD-1 family protein [Candidatus Nanoarchaeia archaeon]|nr:Mov34/MPN/PAD-1 family protein [Candidatus Nanoarchaeia archaeon]MDD5740522.1 Mov34/MPN/PAD-1 family protein [Candidatus Nanoarchaeia archaeon]
MEINQNITDIEKLVITKNTLNKIKAYSKIVCEKGDIECYGFLLNPKSENNHIIYNAILACDQMVSGVEASIGPEGAFKSKAEIENLGYDAIGCWHSHHGMGAWHSGTDDRNLEKLVHSIAGNREIILIGNDPVKNEFERNRFLIREGGVELEIKSTKPFNTYTVERKIINPKINYMHTKDNKFYFNIGGKTIFMPLGEHTLTFKETEPQKLKSLGYAYSLVASEGKFYAEVALKEICTVCEKSHITKKPIKLEIIETEDDIKFSEEGIREEIRQKVKKPGLLGIFSR